MTPQILGREATRGTFAPRPLSTTAAAVVGIQLGATVWKPALGTRPGGSPPYPPARPGLIPRLAHMASRHVRNGRGLSAGDYLPSGVRLGSFHDPERSPADRLEALAIIVTHRNLPSNSRASAVTAKPYRVRDQNEVRLRSLDTESIRGDVGNARPEVVQYS